LEYWGILIIQKYIHRFIDRFLNRDVPSAPRRTLGVILI
jgi:hypothetical protein